MRSHRIKARCARIYRRNPGRNVFYTGVPNRRLDLEGRTTVEGDWTDGVTGLRGMRVEIAMMRTPDGQPAPSVPRLNATFDLQ